MPFGCPSGISLVDNFWPKSSSLRPLTNEGARNSVATAEAVHIVREPSSKAIIWQPLALSVSEIEADTDRSVIRYSVEIPPT